MNAEAFKVAIATNRFRTEINSLLWSAPFANHGKRDEGWGCREHALFLGALGMLHGREVHARHGRTAFVQGANGDKGPFGLFVEQHAWVHIGGVGTCDLSMRFDDSTPGGDWTVWRGRTLIGSRIIPLETTNYFQTRDTPKYEAFVNYATNQEKSCYAVYLVQRSERLGVSQVAKALAWCNSPLSVRIKKAHVARTGIYAAAILHLDGVLTEVTEPLAGKPQSALWAEFAQRSKNANDELQTRLERVGV